MEQPSPYIVNLDNLPLDVRNAAESLAQVQRQWNAMRHEIDSMRGLLRSYRLQHDGGDGDGPPCPCDTCVVVRTLYPDLMTI